MNTNLISRENTARTFFFDNIFDDWKLEIHTFYPVLVEVWKILGIFLLGKLRFLVQYNKTALLNHWFTFQWNISFLSVYIFSTAVPIVDTLY